LKRSVSDFASFILDGEGLAVNEQETADTKNLEVEEYDDDDIPEVKPFNAESDSPSSYKNNIAEYQKRVTRRKKELGEGIELKSLKKDPL